MIGEEDITLARLLEIVDRSSSVCLSSRSDGHGVVLHVSADVPGKETMNVAVALSRAQIESCRVDAVRWNWCDIIQELYSNMRIG